MIMDLPSLENLTVTKLADNSLRMLHAADIQVNCAGVWKHREYEYRYMLRLLAINAYVSGSRVVVLPGDIFERANTSDDEKSVLTDWLNDLLSLGLIIVITAGNHDLQQKNFLYDPGTGEQKTRTDSIELVVSGINHPNLHYIQKSSFYQILIDDQPIIFANWSHKTFYSNFTEAYNPWDVTERADKIKALPAGIPIIDLYHNPVYNCIDWDGSVVKGRNDNRTHPNEFKGHIALLGDIHHPYIGTNDTGTIWTYPSSPVIRNYGEGDYYVNDILTSERLTKHGYNLVDIQFTDKNKKPNYSINFYSLPQYAALHTIDLNQISSSIIDNFELVNASEFVNNIRIRTSFTVSENQELLSEFVNKLKSNYAVRFIDVQTPVTSIAKSKSEDNSELEGMFSQESTRELCLKLADEYLENATDSETLRSDAKDKFVEFLDKALSTVSFDSTKTRTVIDKIRIKNFMSFDDIEIDFTKFDENTLNKVGGPNGVGKTTLLTALTWCVTDQFDHRQVANRKSWLVMLFNDKLPEEDQVFVEIDCRDTSGNVYRIKRELWKVWKSDATKSIKNWKNEIQKVNQEFSIIANPDTENADTLLPDTANELIAKLFGQFWTFVEMHNIDSHSLNSLLNKSTDDLIYWILYQIGAGFVLDLQGTSGWIKSEMLDNVKKPSKQLHEVEFELLEHKELIENFKKIEDETKIEISEITKLNDLDISAKAKLEMLKVEPLSDELSAKTEESIKSEIAAKNIEIDNIRKDISDKELSIVTSEAKNKAINDSIDELSKKKELNNTDILSKNDKKNESIVKSSEINGKIDKLVADLKSDYLSESNSISNKIDTELKEQQVFSTELETILTDYKKLKLADLEVEKKAKEESITKIDDGITKLQSSKTDTEANIRVSNEKITEWSELLNEPICTKCKQPMSTADSLTNSITEEKDKIDKFNLSITKIDDALKLLTDNKETAKTSVSEIQQRIDNIRDNTKSVLLLDNCDYLIKYNSVLEKSNNKQLIIDNYTKTKTELSDKISKLEELGVKHELISVKADELTKLNQIELDTQAKINTEIVEINNKNIEISSDIDKKKLELIDISAIRTEISELNHKISNIQNTIDSLNRDITTILKWSEDNAKWLESAPLIESLTKKITESALSITALNEKLLTNSNKKAVANETITNLTSDINIIKTWNIAQLANNTFQKTVGDKILQNELFGRLIKVLNADLSDLLKDVNFSIGFDSDSYEFIFVDTVGDENSRPVLMISGMEKTFSGLALIAVIKSRKLKHNIDIVMLDELTGKLNNGDEISEEATQDYLSCVKDYQELCVTLLRKFINLTNSKVLIVDHILPKDSFDNKLTFVKKSNGTTRLLKS